jgi:hypothetical protein
VKLGIVVFLVLIIVAGGIAGIAAVLALLFDLAWEHRRSASRPASLPRRATGQPVEQATTPARPFHPPGQEAEQQ